MGPMIVIILVVSIEHVDNVYLKIKLEN